MVSWVSISFSIDSSSLFSSVSADSFVSSSSNDTSKTGSACFSSSSWLSNISLLPSFFSSSTGAKSIFSQFFSSLFTTSVHVHGKSKSNEGMFSSVWFGLSSLSSSKEGPWAGISSSKSFDSSIADVSDCCSSSLFSFFSSLAGKSPIFKSIGAVSRLVSSVLAPLSSHGISKFIFWISLVGFSSTFGCSKETSVLGILSHSWFSIVHASWEFSTVEVSHSATELTTSSKLKSDNADDWTGVSAAISFCCNHCSSCVLWPSAITGDCKSQKSKLKSLLVGFDIFSNFSKLSNTSWEPQNIGFFSASFWGVTVFAVFAAAVGFISAIVIFRRI